MSRCGHYTLSRVILNRNDVEQARSGRASPKLLAAVLDYCPKAGTFFWRPRPEICFSGKHPASRAKQWNGLFAGKECFTARDTNGYAQGCVFQRHYTGHRVAWAIYYGEWPKLEIDHIDRVKDNNAINNLRVVSRSENLRNRAPASEWRSIGLVARSLVENTEAKE